MVINGAKVKINAQISNFDIKLFINDLVQPHNTKCKI